MATIAVTVFGKPITEGTRTQRALAALNNQNEGGKFDQVLLAQKVVLAGAGVGAGAGWGAGIGAGAGGAGAVANNVATVSTTFGRIYNATGDTLTYVTFKDWEGKVVGKYPTDIQNGQWAIFQHVGSRVKQGRQGSVAAVVYRIQDYTDSMIAWNNLWKSAGTGGNNTAYCEMNVVGYFEKCDWNAIYKKLKASRNESKTSMESYATKVSIDAGGNAPTYTAMFYLNVV